MSASPNTPFPRTPSIPHRLSSLACAVLLALGGGYAQAQEDADEKAKAKEKAANITELDVIEVTGQFENRDEAGYDNVFLKDVSNVYLGKEEIERYKGTSVGDLFKGLNGVYSGDSRNSGAVDPNIRGLQGGGRIPLTIDGTEQSTSVWMGPAGVSNRNYLDPNMVSSIMVEKGPSMTRGVRAGMGGSVQVKTLEVDDIVRPGETFGFELKTETATNSVKPNTSHFSYFGKDYRDIHGAYSGYLGGIFLPTGNGIDITPRKGSSGKDFNFNDNSYRIAIANKHEKLDLLAAYSYRKRGNYFSGKGGSQHYETDSWYEELKKSTENTISGAERQPLPTQYIANYFLPGQEVTNTSNELESILLKGTFRLPNEQTINLGYMRIDNTFGESIPWLISYAIRDSKNANGTKVVQGQYPFSNVKQNTYNLNYAWKPEGNRWVDFEAGAWMTQSEAARHQSGDTIFGLEFLSTQRDKGWDDYVICHVRPTSEFNVPNRDKYCANIPKTPPDKLPNTNGRYNIVPRALRITNDDQWGFNLSNKFRLHPTLDLIVSGDFTRQKLKQWNASEKAKSDFDQATYGVHYYAPRAGTREQYNFAFNFNWMATSWLQLNAGYRYSDYWARDDKVASQRVKRAEHWDEPAPFKGIKFTYREIASDADAAAYKDELRDYYYEELDYYESVKDDFPEEYDWFLADYPTVDDYVHDLFDEGEPLYLHEKEVIMPYGGTHKGFAANNPFLNGTINLDETVETTQTPNGVAKKYRVDGTDRNHQTPGKHRPKSVVTHGHLSSGRLYS